MNAAEGMKYLLDKLAFCVKHPELWERVMYPIDEFAVVEMARADFSASHHNCILFNDEHGLSIHSRSQETVDAHLAGMS